MKAFALAAGMILAAVPPLAMALSKDGDVAEGKRVYAQCAGCHKIDASGKSGIGPNLYDVFGKRAGAVAGYRFSPTMAKSKMVWDEKTLDAFLASPSKSMPGNRMMYGGLSKPADRKNVIAYIKSTSR